MVLESKERLERLRRKMVEEGFQCFLISKSKNVLYLTGFSEGFLILPETGDPQLFVSPLGIEEAKERAKGCQIIELRPGERIFERVAAWLADTKARKVFFDGLEFQFAQLLKERLELELKDGMGYLWNLRKVKDEGEIEKIAYACKLASLGMKALRESLRIGVEERFLAAIAEFEMRRKGSDGTAFSTIVASGPRGAMPHAVASSRAIQEGDVLVVDLGATVEGYASDMTRTFLLPRASEKAIELLDIVERAQNKAFEGLKSGISGKEADSIARDIITKAGYGEKFIHSLGHGVGLEVHEPPSLSQQETEILKEGYVVTVEPGIYIKGFGGFRVEDTVLICRDGARRLTFDL